MGGTRRDRSSNNTFGGGLIGEDVHLDQPLPLWATNPEVSEREWWGWRIGEEETKKGGSCEYGKRGEVTTQSNKPGLNGFLYTLMLEKKDLKFII